jgi:hypothetical protein
MRPMEDYDFLLRICTRYEASFKLAGKVVGGYDVKT